MPPIPRIRAGNYPAILSYVFRPLFLAGALYAGATILFWLPFYDGEASAPTAFSPIDWHAHEMLFGYVGAVAAGFILMSVPNWTGRLPVQGLPLLLLLLLWLAGRLAVFWSADIGWLSAALIDCAFLAAVAAATAREIIAGRNWRNLKVLLPLSVFLGANVLMHVEAHFSGTAAIGRRLGLATLLTLITIVGGRLVPSFTKNWLARHHPGKMPVPFNRFDLLTIILTATALALWTFCPEGRPTGLLLLVAAVANFLRLGRWAGLHTFPDPMVFILHAGYFFLPLGLALTGASALFPATVPFAAGVHVLGVGAIGCMTLAVMTRISLRHTGRAVVADQRTRLVYLAILLAALLRGAAAFFPGERLLLTFSAACWVFAFLAYAAHFAPILAAPRTNRGRPTKRRTSAEKAPPRI